MGFEFKEETGRLIGCAMEVHRELGPGLSEKPYENALAVELGLQGIPFEQQARFDVLYKKVKVANYIPDLIAFDSVVVDAKVIKEITEREIAQMMTYLRVTGLTVGLVINSVGLVINFSAPSLQWKRVVHSKRKAQASDFKLL